jgi:putative endonuclease
MKVFTTEKQKTGELGETIACTYLSELGFDILERNYSRKWGEIDVIAWKSGVIHFIEVKSVSCENNRVNLRPEDQMSAWKQRKLMTTIELYVNSKAMGEWQFDIVCVYLNHKTRRANVKLLENIILEC